MRYHPAVLAALSLLVWAAAGCSAAAPTFPPSISTLAQGNNKTGLPFEGTPIPPLAPADDSGSPGISFEEGLPVAGNVAAVWSAHATLFRAEPLPDEAPPGLSGSLQGAAGVGRAARWQYEFYDPMGEVGSALRVIVGTGGYECSELISLPANASGILADGPQIITPTLPPVAPLIPAAGEASSVAGLSPEPEEDADIFDPLRALEAYERAEAEVLKRSPSTQVTMLESLPGGVSLDGTASGWRIRFSGLDEAGNAVQYLVEVVAGQAASLESAPILVNSFRIQAYETWLIDSASAIDLAEALGGAGFRQRYPEAVIDMALWWTNLDAANRPRPTYAPHWEVRYSSEDGSAQKTFFFSGAWGDDLQILSNDTAGTWNNLTARQAYPAAGEFIAERLPGLSLIAASASGGLLPDGKAPRWLFTFVPAEGSAESRLAYLVGVSSNGVDSAWPEPVHGAPKDGRWEIDSDAAAAVCEQAGGANMRQQYSGLMVYAEMAMSEVFGMPEQAHLPLWNLIYSEPGSGQSLSCWVDARTGELAATRP